MATLMPEGIFHMNKRLQELIKEPSGGYTLIFQDGTKVKADAVVGADGIKSRTRQIVLGDDNPDAWPKYSGDIGIRVP